MSKRSISRTPRQRKQPTPTAPPPHGDVICPRPRCRATAGFSSTEQRVWCHHCPWQLALTPEQTGEIAAALAGMLPDLNIPAYLVILQANAEEGGQPPPPLDHLATILLRRALLALDTGVAA